MFNKLQDFNYTGSEQTYTVPADGYYKIEAWGAQGWPEVTDLNTGLGGYTSGYIYLTKGENLYVYVGQGNGNGQNIAAFNNGTPNYGGYSGGGATDIRLVGGTWTDATSINSRIVVELVDTEKAELEEDYLEIMHLVQKVGPKPLLEQVKQLIILIHLLVLRMVDVLVEMVTIQVVVQHVQMELEEVHHLYQVTQE